jgi:hypothetical protein
MLCICFSNSADIDTVKTCANTDPIAIMNNTQCFWRPDLKAAPTQDLDRYVKPAPALTETGPWDIEIKGWRMRQVTSTWSHHSPTTMLTTVGAIEMGANVEKLNPNFDTSAS